MGGYILYPITDILVMKTQYKTFVQLIYMIFYLIFSTQNWLEIEILELQKEIVERTKLTNIFYFLQSREKSEGEKSMNLKFPRRL